MDEKLPGTPIRGNEWESETYSFRHHSAVLKYAWDAGFAVSGFLEGLKDGRILGRRCNRCGRILVPPRAFCEKCFRPTDEWVEVRDTGKINTYSVSYVNNDASRRMEPLIIAVIEIDGASPGMGFLHVLGEVEPTNVRVGMGVKAVWKPKDERVGAITDIKYFKPLEA
ncbi:MAG: Zn-ribbon domain-containing OB-fold protein [Thermoprotei archaeon]